MRRSAAACLLFMLLANALMVSGVEGADGAGFGADGRGTSRATILIHDVFELQNMSKDLDGSYALANDIDASATGDWDSGAGFIPVGNSTNNFNGSLDGNGHNISGLYINRPGTGYIGLLGYAGKVSSVKNIGVVKINVTGNYSVGGLVGKNDYGTVNNSHATGKVAARSSYSSQFVGGLVGSNTGTISNSYAAGNVTGTSYDVGGLVGFTNGTISNSSFTGNVTGDYIGVGGLVGALHGFGTVNNSYAIGNVTGPYSVGGLVGWTPQCGGSVMNSHAIVNVTGRENTGGLVGSISYASIWNSYASGNVRGGNYTGGLLGHGISVYNSYSTADVTGGNYTGGLIGAGGEVNNSYATGSVTGNNYVGGLIGCESGYGTDPWPLESNSYSAGKVTGTGSKVGGLNGDYSNSLVYNCFWDIETSNQNSSAGGTGKTTKDMKTRGTFTVVGWDFNDVWFMVENVTYPVFQWQDITFPVADAGIDQTINEGIVVTFDGRGSSDLSGIANYTWSFRDGNPRTIYGVGPIYKFINPGIFNIELKVTNIFGYWNNDTMTVTVNDITPPVSNAGPDQIVDEGTLVTFSGSGSSDNVGIMNFTWTFSDGAPVTLYGAQPTYQFDKPGIFDVTLIVRDAAGHRGNDSMTVTVIDKTPPVVNAGPDETIDEGTLMTFDGTGSIHNVGVINFTWTFRDGAPVALYGSRPTYMFDNPGIFVVTLNATDAAANWGIDTMTVTVKDVTAPVANAGQNLIVDEKTSVMFNGSGSFDNVGVVNYTWNFTDGVPVSLFGSRPTYRFDNPGIFVVTLNVTDAAGNWKTDTLIIKVRDITSPVANAGLDQTMDEKTSVIFNGSGSSDNVGIVNYCWTFEYGAKRIVLSGISPLFFFEVPGVYSVRLNVTDAAGHWTEDIMVVTVRDITPPVAAAGRDRTIPAGRSIAFDGSLSTDNVAISKCFWNFTYGGKAESLEGKNVSFKFDKPGVYEVVLTVIDAAGNRGQDQVVVTVEPSVNVDYASLAGLLWMAALLIAIAVFAGFIVLRKRKARKGGPMKELGTKPGRHGRNPG